MNLEIEMLESLLLAALSLQSPKQTVEREVPLGHETVTFNSRLFGNDLRPMSRLRGQIFIWSVRAGARSDSLFWLSEGTPLPAMFWTGATRFESVRLLDIGIYVSSVRSHEK